MDKFGREVQYIFWILGRMGNRQVVDQWLERTTADIADREVMGSNPTGAASELSQFRLLHFVRIFWRIR